ncbi:unnamed protein product [Polarella glacialis]|uniref:Prolyl endopeptidase n=1 Tax=Polarella glacialis TaxID=89957 RepID=A0A813L557_POLGL|nr:unnamed protein product [Polarella glacialis]
MRPARTRILGAALLGSLAPLASRLGPGFSLSDRLGRRGLAAAVMAGRPGCTSFVPAPRRWLSPCALLAAARPVRCQSTAASQQSDDPFQWLEEVQGEEALAWVKARNQEAVADVSEPKNSAAYGRILAILDSKEKIPYVSRLGRWYYNFWQDEQHQKGLWRRTDFESYRSSNPAWEIVLDLDQLAEQEGISWVWSGYNALDEGPGSKWDRALVTLSPGGSDAVVVREFDLDNCRFIPESEGGFELPEAKSSAGYRNRDELVVGTDFGEGSLTASGYPRVSKAWKRGTPLSEAVTVFEGEHDDISADQVLYYDRGEWHEFQNRALDFYHNSMWYRRGDPTRGSVEAGALEEFVRIPVPEDAGVGTFKDAAIVTLRSDWEIEGKLFKSGSLLSLKLSSCVAGIFSDIQVLFEPTARSSLQDSVGTHNFMVLSILNNVRTELQYWRYLEQGRWEQMSSSEPGGEVPVGCDVQVSAVWPDESDEIWVVKDGYLQPDLLQLASAADCGAKPQDIKSKPAMFDASGLVVEQAEAESLDGTKVPYFMIRRKDVPLDGTTPTLLDGYGGFEIPMTPGYSAGVGAAWLERGGIKVIANIRGGGEFGPSWHQAALQGKRHKAFEDFEAVARDLCRRQVTSPEHLACIGGSNGGLLVGNMLTREGAALFGAVVCQVPLLDMKRYHKLLAGASWMAEYGDPDQPEEWDFIRGFSPYHRVQDVCLQPGSGWKCPQVLFTTSTKDDRVHPGHARKMVKRLKEEVPAELAPKILYWENIEGGHGGAADNTQKAYMWALTYDFLWQTIGRGSSQRGEAPASKL